MRKIDFNFRVRWAPPPTTGVARSALADANKGRDWRLVADFAQVLIGIARPLYAAEPFGVELAATVYAFDSTTLDLCLALFPWAHFRQTKGAIKLHTLLNLRGNIPEFLAVSAGTLHDLKALDWLCLVAGADYVVDRGYLDFARLFRFQQAGAFFVTRAKANLQVARRYSHPVDKTTGIRCDQTIVLTSPKTATLYPLPLRRIRYTDPETGKRLVFLTNDFTLPAGTIAHLYKARWRAHRSPGMDCPVGRPVQLPDQGAVVAFPDVDGLYLHERVAA